VLHKLMYLYDYLVDDSARRTKLSLGGETEIINRNLHF
jgi:hypothetical protein